MFVFKNKNCKIFNEHFFSNFLTWIEKFFWWKYCYLGLFFDDLFAIFLKKISKNLFLIPGFYFFDKYFSTWTSYNFFKKKFYFFSYKLLFEKNNNSLILYTFVALFLIFCGLLVVFIIIF